MTQVLEYHMKLTPGTRVSSIRSLSSFIIWRCAKNEVPERAYAIPGFANTEGRHARVWSYSVSIVDLFPARIYVLFAAVHSSST